MLEGIGRNAMRALIATQFPPTSLTLFVMASNHPGAFVTQGNDGSVYPYPHGSLYDKASELTALTGGGVFAVRPDSGALSEHLATTVGVLQRSDLTGPVAPVPLPASWIALLTLGAALGGAWVLRRRT